VCSTEKTYIILKGLSSRPTANGRSQKIIDPGCNYRKIYNSEIEQNTRINFTSKGSEVIPPDLDGSVIVGKGLVSVVTT